MISNKKYKIMESIFNNFTKLLILEKIVLILILLLPFSLLTSIFIADLFTSIIALVVLFWLFKNKEFLKVIINIWKPLLIILVFYFFIIVSLIFSYDVNRSFLPSFFYFRYFSFSSYFFFYKFEFSKKLILFSLLFLFTLMFVDSIYEVMQMKNFFGLILEPNRINTDQAYFLTGFFDDEKKLGSFIVRLLPFIISLIILLDFKLIRKIDSVFLILIPSTTIIFLTSERVALFLLIIFFIFSFKFFKNKLLIVITSIFVVLFISYFEHRIVEKYIHTTLHQIGITKSLSLFNKKNNMDEFRDKKKLMN